MNLLYTIEFERQFLVMPSTFVLPPNHGNTGTNRTSLGGDDLGLVGGTNERALGGTDNGLGDLTRLGVPDLGGDDELHFESFACWGLLWVNYSV